MSERGNSTHGPRQDDEMKYEAQPIVQGHGQSHVEEWRQSEPMPDDTDSDEIVAASGVDGEEADASVSSVPTANTDDEEEGSTRR
ncbi:hypothetical protein GCM10027416_22160 [Okibacterium endophyticum]